MGNIIEVTPSIIGDDYCDCEDTGVDEIDSVLHSKVSDGVCDCCDGSDEEDGKCPNSCGVFFRKAVDLGTARLQQALTGYRQSIIAAEEGSKKLESLRGKKENLLKDRANVFDLANYIEFYLKSESRFQTLPYPRMDYKLQAARLKAVSEGKRSLGGRSEMKKTVDNQLQAILDTKCPTSEFTLEEFLATYSADPADPRRRDDQTSRKRGQIDRTLIAPLIEDPAKLGLRIIGIVVFTPVRSVGLLVEIGSEWMWGVEEEEEEVKEGVQEVGGEKEGGVYVEPTAFEIIKASNPWTPIGFLILLGDLHPALDYRRYKATRVPVNAARRGYRKYVMRPINTMWEAPEVLYNETLNYRDNIATEPDTHEFRLLKAAEAKAEQQKKLIEKKITAAKQEAERDYGALITIESECFSNTVDKYTYRICPLKDVRQDATSLGRFTGWVDDSHTSYFIRGGTKCFGVTEVDENGNNVQVQRRGVVNLKCGLGHSIVSVVENSPCIYEVEFQTPLACNEEEVGRAEERLRGFMKIAESRGGIEVEEEKKGWFGGGGGGDGGARKLEDIKKTAEEVLVVAEGLLPKKEDR
ncbi:hypothetical protein TL16_g06616 [Triparma laevis f. inornata]|uniref:Glucosidase 2 subunit beta n=1 Tax=Triparma laevis f. inornata TaxID=1714386 RepID=A0A9W7EB81_9STRA|nr:hypothetical protein TL16_g06616 [Triparma laevis f. inornata]